MDRDLYSAEEVEADQHKDDYHLPLRIPDRGLTSETKQDNHPLNQNHVTLPRFLQKSYMDLAQGNLTPVHQEVFTRTHPLVKMVYFSSSPICIKK